MNLIKSVQAQTRLVTHGRGAPVGRIALTAAVSAWMTAAVVGCGDDGGGYDYYDNNYYPDDAYAECDSLVDDVCNYWLECGVLAQSDYSECVLSVRDTFNCSRAIDTSSFYGACVNSLRTGTCDAANQGTIPGVCTGVIIVQ